jgi:hypothetical protein
MSNNEISAFDMAAAFHGRCREIESFIDKSVRPIVERSEAAADSKKHEYVAYSAALMCSIGWLRSFAKLDEPGDFQAVVSGTRALFEIAVDLTLISSDDDHYTQKKLSAWEVSAKYLAAGNALSFYDTREKDPPDAIHAWRAFVANNESKVVADRAAYWGGKHRSRWTGSSLKNDAARADETDQQGFLEWYRVRYPSICWNTHGSGAAGIAGIPVHAFPGLAGLAFHDAFHFSLVIARKCLELVEAYDDISKERFDRFERDSKVAAGLRLLNLPGELFV